MKGHNTTLMQWAINNGATREQLNEMVREVALANGATALDCNTAIFQFLRDQGYTGSLSEMFNLFQERDLVVLGQDEHWLTVEQVAVDELGFNLAAVGEYRQGQFAPRSSLGTVGNITKLSCTAAGAFIMDTDGDETPSAVVLYFTLPGFNNDQPFATIKQVNDYWLSSGATLQFSYLLTKVGQTLKIKVSTTI